MIRTLLIAVLFIGIVATGYWGYTEHRDKNAILIHAENNYQQSFHQLNFYVDTIQNKLGSTLAMSSKSTVRPELANVWRLSTMAHSAVGQLPLSLMPFNKTEKFLADIGEFSYRTGIKEQDQSKLTNQEYKTLKSLYSQSTKIETELQKVQTIALKHHLRWMDVELALSTQQTPSDNSIIDGLKLVNKTVDGFDNNWGPQMTKMNQYNETKYNKITGKQIDKNEAIHKAKSFLNIKNVANVNVQKMGKGANYPAFTVTFDNPKAHETTDVSVTQKGGHVSWYLKQRPIKYQKLSLNAASKQASNYLKNKHIQSMTLVQSDQYDHIGVFSFVKKADNVRVYPAKITMKIALDNGEVIGYNSVSYLINNEINIALKPKLSENDILEKLNPNVKVQEVHLALIKSDFGDDVLCYEILGIMNKQTYQMFINANDGKEEHVQILKDNSSSYAT